MLSRAFTKPRKSFKDGGDHSIIRSETSILQEYEDCIVGFMDDLPLVMCDDDDDDDGCGAQLSLRGVLRGSVGVMGESRMGMTEKVVMFEGKVYAVKRFRKVSNGRGEFGRRVERFARISRRSEYLVPVTAYLYAKRIKIVLCDYYPMGSLADLLAGARELGHTALDWKQRLIILLHIARAIAFIHALSPSHERHMQMNVHGNIRTSNVMIRTDFSACLSDYGFTQLAERMEVSDTWQRNPPPPETVYNEYLCQKGDIYNFGVILLDMLGGTKATVLKKYIIGKKKEIKEGSIEFFEFFVEGKERRQAVQVLDIALACTHRLPEERPSMEKILSFLNVFLATDRGFQCV